MERVCHPPGSGSSVFSLSSFGWAANNSLTGVNDNGITRSYTYEDFNRLASSTRVSTPTNYTYDRFGNRYTAGSQNVSFDANNHVASGNGVTYDAAGNTTSEVVGVTTYSYTYDAENRLITFNNGSSSSYVYDALGRRAKRTVSGTGTEYLYDLNGRAISEFASSGGALTRTELYAGALHFATYVASSTFFAYSDWQGTERVRTDPSANVAEYCEWTPWGEFSSCTSGYSYTDPTVLSTHNYAGYERDSETGLDHMWYRYNDSRYGRFMTTDLKEGKFCKPQTVNLYVYVGDNPSNLIDPRGLDWGDWPWGGDIGGGVDDGLLDFDVGYDSDMFGGSPFGTDQLPQADCPEAEGCILTAGKDMDSCLNDIVSPYSFGCRWSRDPNCAQDAKAKCKKNFDNQVRKCNSNNCGSRKKKEKKKKNGLGWGPAPIYDTLGF